MLGSDFLIDVDMVVVAVGAGPNRALFEDAGGLERNERGYIRSYTESGRTSLPNVWAGGDIVTGAATVILAMGAARTAAEGHARVPHERVVGLGVTLGRERTCKGPARRQRGCLVGLCRARDGSGQALVSASASVSRCASSSQYDATPSSTSSQ